MQRRNPPARDRDFASLEAARAVFEGHRRAAVEGVRNLVRKAHHSRERKGVERLATFLRPEDVRLRLERDEDDHYVDLHMRRDWYAFLKVWNAALAWKDSQA